MPAIITNAAAVSGVGISMRALLANDAAKCWGGPCQQLRTLSDQIAARGNEVMASTAHCRPEFATDAEARCSSHQLRLLDVGSATWREIPFPSGIDPAFTFGLWGTDVGWLYAASSALDAPLQWFLSGDGESWKALQADQAPTRAQITVSGSMCVLRSGALVAWNPTISGAADLTTHLPTAPDQLVGTTLTRWQLGTDRKISVEATDWALGFACTAEAMIGSVVPRGQTAANTIARVDLDTLAPIPLEGATVGRPFRASSQASSGRSVLEREDGGVIRCTDEQCSDVDQVSLDLASGEQVFGDLGGELVVRSPQGLWSLAT